MLRSPRSPVRRIPTLLATLAPVASAATAVAAAPPAKAAQAAALPTGWATVVNAGVTAGHAIEAPNNANVRFRSMVTVSLGGTGTIRHVINDRGGPSNSASNVANLVSHP